ncbi:hypothetical protein CEUSTIGMA_g492.t1 [Chlamydomonas eustigma]|uniref:RRM domain-containing protein n=1 Tax=Chlamydomonas eustigma TaxID=1157962 RepID=A0A250WR65_9CHLO|nr:hypothetical protein CEUSTIGMA_g492.t1 [Chlamydomonas eustigma]|eukprot:GAX73040.1 hypothetical protein CEUSTIGMA_g492.t1 [Chlamydomonas eustigma]
MEDDYDYLERQLQGKSSKTIEDTDESDRPSDKKAGQDKVVYHEDKRTHRRERERSLDRGDSGGKDKQRERERGNRNREYTDKDSKDSGKYDQRGGRGFRQNEGHRNYDSNGRQNQKREQLTPEERAVREQEKEIKDMERATRTVFVSNVNLRADEKDVFMFFSQVTTVQDVQMIKDRTKKFRGYVYVELSKPDDVIVALQLTGQPLLGQPVWVKSSEHEKNLQWELEHTRTAQLAEQQHMLAGMNPMLSGLSGLDANTLALLNAQGLGPSGMMPLTSSVGEMTSAPNQDLDDMDEAKGGGLRLNAAARMSLMNKLAGSAGLQMPAASTNGTTGTAVAGPVDLTQGILGPASPIPTQYLLLKNMFSLEEEAGNGEHWDVELAKDISEECSKYGSVAHCHVDKFSKGHVYLQYSSLESAQAAQHGLHGRWFAGKQIASEFQFAHAYQQVFKV